MITILWLHPDPPLPAQEEALQAAFPGCRVVTEPYSTRTVAEVAALMTMTHATEVVCLRDQDLQRRLVESGINPLRPVMVRLPGRPDTPDPDREIFSGGRWFRFSHFIRLTGVQEHTEILKAEVPQ